MSRSGSIKVEKIVSTGTMATPKLTGTRGRKKKSADCNQIIKQESEGLKKEMITDHMPVVKKRKIDRFNGTPEEELLQKLLPDRLAPNLDILIIGINPGLFAAHIGHHYAGPGNHFWKCLYLSGLVPQPMNCYDDIKLQEYGIGFTNICARTTRGSADLKRTEVLEGANILIEKLKEYKPKIAVFNGKGIYEIFSGNKKFTFGKQPGFIEGTNSIAYVMPSSSARCSQLPRAIDKVPFYEALRRLRDYVTGRIPHLDEADVTFPTLELKTAKKEPKEESEDVSAGVLGCGISDSDSQQYGSDLMPEVKQEGPKRGRPKGKSKKKGDELEDEQSDHVRQMYQKGENAVEPITESCNQVTGSQQTSASHPQQFQHSHQSYLTTGSRQSTRELPLNPFSSADFTFLGPASSSTSQSVQNPSMSFPGMSPASSAVLQSAQDFMSGFYADSHQFGMIGFPSVVASQQNSSALPEDSTERQPPQIKAEPVDLD